MKAIKTHELTVLTAPQSETEKLWLYNGLDCCVTNEVLNVLKPQLDNQTRSTYEFSKSLQAPVLEMKLRGVLVDFELRDKVIHEYERQARVLTENFQTICRDGLGLPAGINHRSPAQLKELFYERLRLPPIKKRTFRDGEWRYVPTVERDALEQLENYFLAQPLVSHILGLRDVEKKIGVLKTGIDSDGRMRTSYNIAGTSTGRFSSNLSDFGTGTNLQNIEDLLRSIFVADAGFKFAYIDLEQAESRLVGAIEWNLFHDGTYLDACESGDLHTSVCRLAWGTALPWTGDIRADKVLAEKPFYRQHSYRHMAKVLGHGTNYNGKPHTMAKHTKLDSKLIAEFQSKYFNAFPAHQRWHAAVASELLRVGKLDTLTGRRRWFFGRRNDDATVREAIAYNPQGSVGDILNQGMLKVWRTGLCQLLLQIHDAILIQYPEELEDQIVPELLKTIQVPIELNHNRTLLIPSEAQVGWNWAKESKDNPDGLKKWKGNDSRKRDRKAPSQLDFLLHSVY
ncbi:MAG TPA: DNA polymerase [Candidatus Bathyarchaeia archaeon]|nr:DNA polymerase [Candidatus Bathyarchaeia archaeon]